MAGRNGSPHPGRDSWRPYHVRAHRRDAGAHTNEMIVFSSPDVRAVCQKLTGWEKDSDPEKIFDARCIFCVEQIKQQIELKLKAQTLREPHKSDPA